MRSGSAESPSLALQWKQGGSSFSIVSGLSVANSNEMCMCVMGMPFS
jgi:hypothetical protein